MSRSIARLVLVLMAVSAGAAVGATLWSPAGALPVDNTYNALTPCVVFDSRSSQGATGLFLGPLNGGTPVTYQVTDPHPLAQGGGGTGTCGIPASATAVEINVVAVNALGEGNLRVTDGSPAAAGGVVNYNNLTPKLNTSSSVIIPLNGSGQLVVNPNCGPTCTTDTTEVRGIVLGYFDDTLADRVAALEAKLEGVTRIAPGGPGSVGGKDTLRFSGMNVQIVNGNGFTECTGGTGGTFGADCNGEGNLVVGYARDDGTRMRTGSHNIVVGDFNAWRSFGGLVVGENHELYGRQAAVIGGSSNKVTAIAGGVVVGGSFGQADGPFSIVAGGYENRTDGFYSLVAGGEENHINSTGNFGAAFGGYRGDVLGDWSVAIGGTRSWADGDYALVAGGASNHAIGENSTTVGGQANDAPGQYAVAVGGRENVSGATNGVVAGGRRNESSSADCPASDAFKGAAVFGGELNRASGCRAAVFGGGHTDIDFRNRASGTYSVVVGGDNNRAIANRAAIIGGTNNEVTGPFGLVAGGRTNNVTAASCADPIAAATVSGGRSNTASGCFASVSGGDSNLASGASSSVTGGRSNTASAATLTADCDASLVGSSVHGGRNNTASSCYSTVNGGGSETPVNGNLATGNLSTVSGGRNNTASGGAATVSGGLTRTASGQDDWRAGTLFEDL